MHLGAATSRLDVAAAQQAEMRAMVAAGDIHSMRDPYRGLGEQIAQTE